MDTPSTLPFRSASSLLELVCGEVVADVVFYFRIGTLVFSDEFAAGCTNVGVTPYTELLNFIIITKKWDQ